MGTLVPTARPADRRRADVADAPGDRYTIISADTHAGGSHAQYRNYLDPEFIEEFDAWRGGYKNPFKDLKDDRRSKNWDSGERWADQEADGVVAEVVFPN